MKGNFSRLDKGRGYEAVLLQQGKIQTDADWNTQAFLWRDRFHELVRDVIGPYGSRGNAFQLVVREGHRFRASDSHTIEEHFPHSGLQKFAISVELFFESGNSGTLLSLVHHDRDLLRVELAVDGTLSVALGAEHSQQAVERPRILSSATALPPDTVITVRVECNEHHARLVVNGKEVSSLPFDFRHLLHAQHLQVGSSKEGAALDGTLLRLSVEFLREHDGAWSEAWRWNGNSRNSEAALREALILLQPGRMYVEGVACDFPTCRRVHWPAEHLVNEVAEEYAICYLECQEETVTGWDDRALTEIALDGADSALRLRSAFRIGWLPLEQRTAEALRDAERQASDVLDELAPKRPLLEVRRNPAAAELGNSLYRIEAHGDSSWKWARGNGSVTAGIRHIDTEGVAVELDFWPQDADAFAKSDWVELAGRVGSGPGTLAQIQDLDPYSKRITLSRLPADGSPMPLRLIRWDGAGADGLPLRPGEWTLLECGIQARFTSSTPLTPGDWWGFTSRAATQEIGWPGGNGQSKALEPMGAPPVRAPLALLARSHKHAPRVQRSFHRQISSLDRLNLIERREGTDRAEIAIGHEAGAAAEQVLREIAKGTEIFTATEGSAVEEDLIQSSARTLLRGEAHLRSIGERPDAVADLAALERLEQFKTSRTSTATDQVLWSWSETPPPDWHSAGMYWVSTDPQCSSAMASILSRTTWKGAVELGSNTYLLSTGGELLRIDAHLREQRLSALPYDLQSPSFTTFDNSLWVIGGHDSEGHATARTYRYDLEIGDWIEGPALAEARAGAGVATFDGHLYIVGGWRKSWFGKHALRSVEVLHSPTAGWESAAPLPKAGIGAAIAVCSDGLHVLGGERWAGTYWGTVNTHFRLEARGANWRTDSPLPLPRSRGMARVYGDRIYLFGGEAGNVKRTITTAVDFWRPDYGCWQAGSMHSLAVTRFLPFNFGPHTFALLQPDVKVSRTATVCLATACFLHERRAHLEPA